MQEILQNISLEYQVQKRTLDSTCDKEFPFHSGFFFQAIKHLLNLFVSVHRVNFDRYYYPWKLFLECPKVSDELKLDSPHTKSTCASCIRFLFLFLFLFFLGTKVLIVLKIKVNIVFLARFVVSLF